MIQQDYPALAPRCHFQQGDAKRRAEAMVPGAGLDQDRAVVFLDPYGMPVEWCNGPKIWTEK